MLPTNVRLGLGTTIRQDHETFTIKERLSPERLIVAFVLMIAGCILGGHDGQISWARPVGYGLTLTAALLLLTVRLKSFHRPTKRTVSSVRLLGFTIARKQETLLVGSVRLHSDYIQAGKGPNYWEFWIWADGDTTGAIFSRSYEESVELGEQLARFLGADFADETSDESRRGVWPDQYGKRGLSIR